eukprot:TRINITY_DN106049_c0_g1_i1.p2 TRINITY_DN106049_c0_g1~~TRINITY_DN106049_c0_g1_i1.p2  ORF type:complete len:100 (+),score=8.46 TRINITY_DN106049_c0_g1_i1:224-523(+)
MGQGQLQILGSFWIPPGEPNPQPISIHFQKKWICSLFISDFSIHYFNQYQSFPTSLRHIACNGLLQIDANLSETVFLNIEFFFRFNLIDLYMNDNFSQH